MCDGKPVHVGQNLYSALSYLRRTNEPRVIWADALCINQTDDLEKSRQIALMSSICKAARRVVLWLGEPTETTRNAVPALREVNEYYKRHLWFYDGTFLGLRIRATYFGKCALLWGD